MNIDNKSTRMTSSLSSFTRDIRDYQKTVSQQKEYDPEEFVIKQNMLRIIYYKLYKSKYNNLLRSVTLRHKLKNPPELKKALNNWVNSALTLSQYNIEFLDKIKSLLILKNEASTPAKIALGSRYLASAKQFGKAGIQGTKEIFSKIHFNSLNSQFADETIEDNISKLEEKVRRTKIDIIDKRKDFLIELDKRNDSNKTYADIESGVLNKDLYLKFEEYLKEYETKNTLNLSELYPGLLEDIKLWVKFSSLSVQPPP